MSSKALEEVLEKPEECSSFALIVAALVAYGEGRLEDSAFLFYAGQLRASFDKVCFPPRGQGGDNPFLAIGAMCAQYGGEINSAVMKKPKVYAKAIDRLEKWNPKAPKDYDPGYKFTIRKTEKEATEAEKVHRAEYIKGMKGVATLLNDKEYFAAFKVVQAYNLSPLDNHPTEEVQKARKTMVRIEKEKGIKGFGRL
ncbi:MAG: hypothetical protein JW818_06115 [Pirellulales bacterium]|nr:hypothetical protein [Pirellulales bacterium]